MASFIQTLRTHAKQVFKLEDTQAKDFLAILRQTEAEIVGRLATVTDADTAFSTFQLQRILAEVKAAISGLEVKASNLYGDAQTDAIDLAIQSTVSEITHVASLAGDDAASLDLSLDAAAGLSDPAQGLLADHFATSVKSYGAEVLNAVRRRIQVGMITGDASRAVVGDVQKLIAGSRPKAEQLIRTETSAAYGAAQHRSISEASKSVPGLKKVWIHQSSYPCPICIKLHGTERPIDGTWTVTIGKRTKKVAHVPAHPNCTCRVAAMTPTWRNKLEKLGYLDQSEPEDSE